MTSNSTKAPEALSPERPERLDELTQASKDVRSDVADELETTEEQELSPEQVDYIVGKLKTRFEASKELHEEINFADVKTALRESPEKLHTLYKLEETGGEPQVIGLDGDEFVFEERSKEAPADRKDVNYHQAEAQAKAFGAEMMSPEDYEAMQETGEFDSMSATWLKTSAENLLHNADAQRGTRLFGFVTVGRVNAWRRDPIAGWRGKVRVKKV